MILYIDTTNYNQVTFALAHQDKLKKKSYGLQTHESFKILRKLEEFLKAQKVKSGYIKRIMVNKGPGSFMGIRVGMAMAMALGLAWNVLVKAVAKEKFKIL
jgi:tRNA threonylcarbamoyladenosine biosynthesis protein TsaB